MLTVASPREGEVQLALRARAIRAAIERTRETARAGSKTNRVSLVTLYPHSIGTDNVVRARDGLAQYLSAHNIVRDLRTFGGSGFVGIDGVVGAGPICPRSRASLSPIM